MRFPAPCFTLCIAAVCSTSLLAQATPAAAAHDLSATPAPTLALSTEPALSPAPPRAFTFTLTATFDAARLKGASATLPDDPGFLQQGAADQQSSSSQQSTGAQQGSSGQHGNGGDNPDPRQIDRSIQRADKQRSPDMPPSPALPPPQPKRILGLMPNYRAVSAGVLPPPPSSHEAFMDATENAFDYSAFTFVGMTSLLAEASNSHPEFHKGVGGYYSYYWRGFIDKSDGDYWVDWVLPTLLHEDERYYAMGRGPVTKRVIYAATRVFITPNYKGKNTFNAAELLGRGIAQGISVTYYPSQSDTISQLSSKYAYSILRDAATNVFREVWPDISARIMRPKS